MQSNLREVVERELIPELLKFLAVDYVQLTVLMSSVDEYFNSFKEHGTLCS